MKKFLLKIFAFFSIIMIFFSVSILLPLTKTQSNVWVSRKIAKDSLLKNVPSPRIIFVGGSNVSLGLNSQIIKDSLMLNPINTATVAQLGLVYMLNHTLTFIKKGDVIVIMPEYEHFYGDLANGGALLLDEVLSSSYKGLLSLTPAQCANIYSFFPEYCLCKWKIINDISFKNSPLLNEQSSYNIYGDYCSHWSLPHQNFKQYPFISNKFNYAVIKHLINFNQQLQKIGATLFISYPGYSKSFFNINKTLIMKVEEELKKTNITLLGTPERYEFEDSMMFNTQYHLIKKGVDIRTGLLIEDLKMHLRPISKI